VPTVSPGEMDIYALAASVSTLTVQFDALTKRMDSAVTRDEMNAAHHDIRKRMEAVEASSMAVNYPMLLSTTVPVESATVPQSAAAGQSFAVAAGTGSGDMNNKRRAVIRVRGSCSSDKIKAVPRVKTLSAFVGRLDMETTAEDLAELLEKVGVKVVKCFKLKAKPDSTWKTAAFYVSCEEVSKDLFYNESI